MLQYQIYADDSIFVYFNKRSFCLLPYSLHIRFTYQTKNQYKGPKNVGYYFRSNEFEAHNVSIHMESHLMRLSCRTVFRQSQSTAVTLSRTFIGVAQLDYLRTMYVYFTTK